MSAARTLQERLKFDHGLTIGQHLVKLTHQGNERLALVRIGSRGKVSILPEPRPADMYSSWARLKGDNCVSEGGVYVWAASTEPDLMAQFRGEPAAVVPVKTGAAQ